MPSNHLLSHMPTQYEGLWVRINGIGSATAPSSEQLGHENTSCSIFDTIEGSSNRNIFHLLADCGSGILESLKKGLAQEGQADNALPDAVLITHAHKDHIADLPALLSQVENKSQQRDFKIYCTRDC